jgi:hypothetical protein
MTNDFSKLFWQDEKNRIEINELLDCLSDPIEIDIEEIYHLGLYHSGISTSEFTRAMLTDFDYPIIVSLLDDYEMIIDGHHRIYKCNYFCRNKIKVRILDLKKVPEKFNMFRRTK